MRLVGIVSSLIVVSVIVLSPYSAIADFDGKVMIYVVEPISRWQDANLDNYSYGFLDFAIDASFSLPDKDMYSQTVIWDANAAGFENVTVDNIMVIAAVFENEEHLEDSYPPYGYWYYAHYADAAAAATPGYPGQNVTASGFTHTVFVEEGTSTG